MKKLILFSLIALGLVTFATQAHQRDTAVLVGAPDIPPPTCLPDNCVE